MQQHLPHVSLLDDQRGMEVAVLSPVDVGQQTGQVGAINQWVARSHRADHLHDCDWQSPVGLQRPDRAVDRRAPGDAQDCAFCKYALNVAGGQYAQSAQNLLVGPIPPDQHPGLAQMETSGQITLDLRGSPPGIVDDDLHHARIAGLVEQAGDRGTGRADPPRDLGLGQVVFVIQAGNLGQEFGAFDHCPRLCPKFVEIATHGAPTERRSVCLFILAA